MDFLGLFRRGGQAGSDGPDGLIGKDHPADLGTVQSLQAFLDLFSNDLECLALLPLLAALPDA